MSRRSHRAPLAVTSDGTVLLNVARFDGCRAFERACDRARQSAGAVFIGIPLERSELREVRARLGYAALEVAEMVVGGRQGGKGSRKGPRLQRRR